MSQKIYEKIVKICPVCKTKFTTQLNHKKEKTVCSTSCSNTYFPRHTAETRKKISTALKRTPHIVICKECGVRKETKHKEQKFCSFECVRQFLSKDPAHKLKLKQAAATRIAKGTHKGWASRNMPSYPETFFMKVLDNNKIPYEFEKPVGKYFIDFAINDKQIALEIDGKQHLLPDRVIKDKEKDKYLTEQGWLMHRIPWTNISCDKGKVYIKNEIAKFVALYNNSSNKFNMQSNTTITELTKQELVTLMDGVINARLQPLVAMTGKLEQQLKQIFINRKEVAPQAQLTLALPTAPEPVVVAVDQKTGAGMANPYFIQLMSKDGYIYLVAENDKHGIKARFFEGREGADNHFEGLPNDNWAKKALRSNTGYTKKTVKLTNKQPLTYSTRLVNKNK